MLRPLKEINFHVYENDIVGIVGPNGSGKSTLLECIAGSLPIKSGEIYFLGTRVDRFSVRRRREMGLMLIPQEENIFPMMTVKKNLEISALLSDRSQKERLINYVYDLFPVLEERRRQIANTLSGGQQRMLAVGIAIVSNARLMLIDEPSIGLAPKLVTRLLETLKQIRKEMGKTIVLSEQNIKILTVADRLFGLEAGEIRFDEKIENLSKERVKNLYLGSG